MPKRIVIIGAGPVGLEAALAAQERGLAVQVFEKGIIADSVRRWGQVRMFSPFGMNVSALGKKTLQAHGISLPEDSALLTGREFAEAYLEPIAALLPVFCQTEVRAVGRAGMLKNAAIGEPERSRPPFQMLVRDEAGERYVEAEVLLDCSGNFATPNDFGAGGLPLPGESECFALIDRGVPDVAGALRSKYAGHRVLVIGAGHSAATVLRELATVKAASPETQIIWATRNLQVPPLRRIPDDALSARDSLLAEVNALASSGLVDWRPGHLVTRLECAGEVIKVTLENEKNTVEIEVDRIVAAVGFRPDLMLTRELQAKLCYATEGAFNLAAALLGETGGDCLAVGGFGPDSLVHPEPNFFILGMKSYGRTPDFLLKTGIEQVAMVMQMIAP